MLATSLLWGICAEILPKDHPQRNIHQIDHILKVRNSMLRHEDRWPTSLTLRLYERAYNECLQRIKRSKNGGIFREKKFAGVFCFSSLHSSTQMKWCGKKMPKLMGRIEEKNYSVDQVWFATWTRTWTSEYVITDEKNNHRALRD